MTSSIIHALTQIRPAQAFIMLSLLVYFQCMLMCRKPGTFVKN